MNVRDLPGFLPATAPALLYLPPSMAVAFGRNDRGSLEMTGGLSSRTIVTTARMQEVEQRAGQDAQVR